MSRRISAQLFDAINARDVATMRSLLASGRLSSDMLIDTAGISAVARAVNLGDVQLLQTLIDAKADVDASVFPPPVRIAVTKGRIDLLRMLLRAGARPCREGGEELYKNNGRTIGNNDLHALALVSPHLSTAAASEFVELLASAGSDVNLVNNDRSFETPLTLALQQKHFSVATALLCRADVDWEENSCSAFALDANASLTRLVLARHASKVPRETFLRQFEVSQRDAPTLLALLGGPIDLCPPGGHWQLDSSAHDEARALIVASELVPDWLISCEWSGRLPDAAAVETARRALEHERFAQARERFFVVCVALQNLHLPAIQTCGILDEVDPRDIALHHRWRIATLVKHFRQRD
jgi:hypothetical protein